MKTQRPKTDLDVGKVLQEFQKAEESTAHRKGTFKIDKPFDEALDKILKVKPASSRIQKGDKNGK